MKLSPEEIDLIRFLLRTYRSRANADKQWKAELLNRRFDAELPRDSVPHILEARPSP